MKYTSFHEDQFRRSVNKALIQTRHILDNERSSSTTTATTSISSSLSSGVGLAGDAPNLYDHTYVDKFTLCECMTNTMIASLMNLFTLQVDGDADANADAHGSGDDPGTTGSGAAASVPIFDIQPHQLQQILAWVHGIPMKGSTVPVGTDPKKAIESDSTSSRKQTLTLRFIAEDTCTLFKEEETQLISHDDREYVTATTTTTTSKGSTLLPPVFGGKQHQQEETTTTSTKVIHRIKEYHWKVGLRYKIIIFPGTSVDQKIVLHERTTQSIVVTQGGNSGSTGTGSIVAGNKFRPIPERTVHPPIDTYCLSYLFGMIDPIQQSSTFTIDRNDAVATKTPRRNLQTEQVLECLRQLQEWSNITQGFFLQRIEKEIMSKHNPVHPNKNNTLDPGTIGMMQGLTKEPTFNGKQIRIVEYYPETQRYKAEPYNLNEGLPNTLSIKRNNIVTSTMDGVDTVNTAANVTCPPLQSISDEMIFCPILPLMDHGNVLSMNEIGYLLQEHTRTIETCLVNLSKMYPSKQLYKLISISEASIVLACKHIHRMIEQYNSSIQYIEDLLYQQLVTAIGKHVDHNDFQSYMKYHYTRFYHSSYAPIPFSHPIRRPQNYPDGIISIESMATTNSCGNTTDTSNVPIETWVRTIPGGGTTGDDTVPSSIYMPIDAAISIEITGDRFLHGWMQHQFFTSKTTKPPQSPFVQPAVPISTDYQLTCRARQFSSFIIVLGTMAGPNKFEPKDAIIVQNKDEVLIPLITTMLPSAKEFKDAIHSLSPEQQEFAKAYRTMQLESSVFGICVIQVKPQLERLLGLPDHTLTKEIQLTQDIMSLFVDYQVPSDLMTYDGSSESTNNEMISVVRGHVGAILKVIDDSKTKQLKDEAMRADMRVELSQPIPFDNESYMMATSSAAVADTSLQSMDGSLDTSRRSRVGLRSLKRLGVPLGRSAQPATAMFDSAASDAALPSASAPKPKKATKRSSVASSIESERKQQKPVIAQDISKAETSTLFPARENDFTSIPKVLDSKLEQYDSDHSLHSVIIKAGTNWTRTRQLNFLTNAQTTCLSPDDVRNEKTQAYALLDALSRSGTLPIACSELHVFVAVSHCFENDVMGTVIQDNVNPIIKVERSSLLLASTIFGKPIPSLIEHDHDLERIAEAFPSLISCVVEAEDASAHETVAVS